MAGDEEAEGSDEFVDDLDDFIADDDDAAEGYLDRRDSVRRDVRREKAADREQMRMHLKADPTVDYE